MKTVSVHIVTYNSASYIEDCLHSLSTQTYPIRKIVIIDNHSADETVAIIKKSMRSAQIPINLIENNHNIGFAAGHNQAIQQTNTEFVLILNPDVTLHPDYLRYTIATMSRDEKVGSITGKLLLTGSDNILDSTGLIIKKTRKVIERGANEQDHNQWDEQHDVFGVSAAAALYRRKMINDIAIEGEFFDESFFAYKEDVDVAWRARLLGWEARYEPGALGYHHRGWGVQKKRKEIPLKIRRHSFLNKYAQMLKNESIGYVLKHLPYILVYEFLAFSYIIVYERELLKDWSEIKSFLKKMYRKRKLVQEKRQVAYKDIYSYFE